MMWNWLNKLLDSKTLLAGKEPQRKRVNIEIPIERHRYRLEDFKIDPASFNTKEDGKDS